MQTSNQHRKIIFVSPHLSTGGLPQYLWKKIQTFSKVADVYCVEYSFYGSAYVVQRNKIESLLGEKFFAIHGQSKDLEKIISNISPDIVHFEEISETFVNLESLERIYSEDRSYFIYETCHSSTLDPGIKRFLPDRFIMVSDWIKKKFQHFGVPSMLLEYPIEDLYPERRKALETLGLDENKKHIINVGLFTAGKNQGELIGYARALCEFPIEFHFVGNQADNFSSYWQPLMQDLPKNCRIWGERNDVDLFYQISDLFVFTSTFELNPLCVKEALSWKNKILMRNLETYSGMYDNNSDVFFLTENLKENAFSILEILGFVKKIK